MEKLIDGVVDLCREVGSYINSEQSKITQSAIDTKGLHDYVTHVDKQSEKLLVDGLSKLLPASGFLVEENTVKNTHKEYTWIVDPLDGTTNFIHGLPTFAISVALMKNDSIVLGAVYDVKAEECFYATEGNGAFMNGKKIQISERSTLGESLLATGFPYNDFSRQEEYLAILSYLMQHCRGIRRFGSAAMDLAWVACGRFDAFWEYSLKPWDVAAGSFIVQQAGGKCSDFKEEQNFIFGKEIVCGNPKVFRELLNIIKVHFE